MKVLIEWMPGEPGVLSTSTRDEAGLEDLFGQAEACRIKDVLIRSCPQPVTLSVNGRDAGFARDTVQARFSVVTQ